MAFKKQKAESENQDQEQSDKKSQLSVRVTVSPDELKLIDRLASLWGRSRSDVVLDGFRRSIVSLVESYQAWKEIMPVDEPDQSSGEESNTQKDLTTND